MPHISIAYILFERVLYHGHKEFSLQMLR